MAHFVLIHGAWHDSRAWERALPELRKLGHEVATPELPGNGRDDRKPGDVTLEAYIAEVGEHVAKAGRSIIVGHSMAGIVVSALGERMPERVAALVYIAAFMLPDGYSIVRFYEEHADPGIGGARAAISMAPDGTYSTVEPSAARELFYNTCAPAEAARAATHLGPMPAQPRRDPVHVSRQRWGILPRYYGRTLKDLAVPSYLQDKMLALQPGAEPHDFDTDHSPFLSAPEAFAAWLHGIARRHG